MTFIMVPMVNINVSVKPLFNFHYLSVWNYNLLARNCSVYGELLWCDYIVKMFGFFTSA